MTEIQPPSVVRSPRIQNMDMNSRSHELHLMNIMKITTVNLSRSIFYIKDLLNVASLLVSLQPIILHFDVAKNYLMYMGLTIMHTASTRGLRAEVQPTRRLEKFSQPVVPWKSSEFEAQYSTYFLIIAI